MVAKEVMGRHIRHWRELQRSMAGGEAMTGVRHDDIRIWVNTACVPLAELDRNPSGAYESWQVRLGKLRERPLEQLARGIAELDAMPVEGVTSPAANEVAGTNTAHSTPHVVPPRIGPAIDRSVTIGAALGHGLWSSTRKHVDNKVFMDNTTLATAHDLVFADDGNHLFTALSLYDLATLVTNVIIRNRIYHLENPEVDDRKLNSLVGDEVFFALPVFAAAESTDALAGIWWETLDYARALGEPKLRRRPG